MSAELLALVLRASLALSAALVIVLALRVPVRALFGARIAYAFWLIAPIALLANFLPARRVLIDMPAAAPAAPIATGAGVTPTLMDISASPLVEPVAPWDAVHAWDATSLLFAVWVVGVVVSLAILIISQRRFLARGHEAGPAVIGIVRPRIVVPSDFDRRYTAEERNLVLAHERAHIAAGDAQVNALAALIQCLNWFNPLVHAARAALRVDQELACDARVMARHAHARRAYAEAMLKTQLAAQAVPLGCAWPPAGLKPLKERISMLAQSPSTLRRSLGVGACAMIAACVGLAAWAAQPPRYAHAEEGQVSARARSLGAELVATLKEGDRASALQLIAEGADVNHWIPGDGTPLVIAAQERDATLARALLEAGADVNRPARGDGNALIMAALNGDLELVTLFVEAGANVNGFVLGDETPLINAARENRLDVARYLIARGADVNLEVEAPTVDGDIRRSPMSVARRGNHAAMIALLRQHGARG